jgi:OmpA-OmpF porin, OOP family
MRKAMVLVVLGLAGAPASPAFAEDQFRGWRLGGWVGQESFQSDVDYVGYFDDVDENRLSYGAFGGWGFNKWLAVEVGYHGGSDFSAHLNSDGAFPTREVEQHTDIHGFEASVVGSWWFTNDFSLYGRAGIFVWKGESTFTEDLDSTDEFPATSRETFEDDGNDPFFGIGIQTEMDGALVRLEYQMVDAGDLEAPGLEMLDNTLESLNLSIVWFLH